MKKTLLYIHGYGSDRTSRKYRELKAFFGESYRCHCLEWVVHSDIPYLLNLAIEKCENIKDLVIVGDSTGANLAYQLREMRNTGADKLILLSPLLDVSRRLRDIPFPKTFEQQLVIIPRPENALIIASRTDDVVDQHSLFEQSDKHFALMEVTDGHRLEKFNDYLPAISDYLLRN